MTMENDLSSLAIDKSLKAPASEPHSGPYKWIAGGSVLFVALSAAQYLLIDGRGERPAVQTVPTVEAKTTGAVSNVTLQATGYVVARHKIQVASKMSGRVAWIGVEKGDAVNAGQVIARLEDAEYDAQLRQAQGNAAAIESKLAELTNGSRTEEIDVAKANLDAAQAELANVKVSLARTQRLVEEGLIARQQLDDATARFESQAARVAALERTYELVRLGPRKEAIAQAQAQWIQAKAQVDFHQAQLDNTIIAAPITGTILERIVEIGEFVTTGDMGTKGYVVSLANLRDLQVELDINQADLARLHAKQKSIITTDAYPDRKYNGVIEAISPEANRQKATVQVRVKVNKPDHFLRPEMNASVAFLGAAK
jgi:HlyD family secretion protein